MHLSSTSIHQFMTTDSDTLKCEIYFCSEPMTANILTNFVQKKKKKSIRLFLFSRLVKPTTLHRFDCTSVPLCYRCPSRVEGMCFFPL